MLKIHHTVENERNLSCDEYGIAQQWWKRGFANKHNFYYCMHTHTHTTRIPICVHCTRGALAHTVTRYILHLSVYFLFNVVDVRLFSVGHAHRTLTRNVSRAEKKFYLYNRVYFEIECWAHINKLFDPPLTCNNTHTSTNHTILTTMTTTTIAVTTALQRCDASFRPVIVCCVCHL